jgi:hypothetical protein
MIFLCGAATINFIFSFHNNFSNFENFDNVNVWKIQMVPFDDTNKSAIVCGENKMLWTAIYQGFV